MRPNYFTKPITKRFIDAFPKFEAESEDDVNDMYFWEAWQESPFYDSTFTKADIKDIYNHLMAAYYNWHYFQREHLLQC